jgi:predicted transcriptional regulator
MKELSIETIKRMTGGPTSEDLMYEINLISQVLEGLKDSEEGRLISTEELLKRVKEWSK